MTEVVEVPLSAIGEDPPPAGEAPLTTGERRVPRSARILGAAGRFFITTGVVVFLFVAYELWGTNIQEARAQSDLRGELDERFAAAADLPDPVSVPATVIEAGESPSTPDALPAPPSTLPGGYDPSVLELYFPPEGEALAKIDLPALGVEKIVVHGVDVADLRKGPGHYPTTPLPGNAGNTSIAGHRTTYGAPFNRIDEMKPGDEIVVTGVQGEFTYRVMDPRSAYAGFESGIESFGEGHIIVRPGAVWVLADFGDNRLTLTACHPKLSARQRIIVAAELVGEPVTLPDWAVQAREDQLATTETTLGADEDFGDDDTEVSDGGSNDANDTVDATAAATGSDPGSGSEDLDRGLSGERDAIPGAVLWILAATTLWVAGGLVGRRLGAGRLTALGLRFAVLLPALVCLWFAFEKVDRALPAG